MLRVAVGAVLASEGRTTGVAVRNVHTSAIGVAVVARFAARSLGLAGARKRLGMGCAEITDQCGAGQDAKGEGDGCCRARESTSNAVPVLHRSGVSVFTPKAGISEPDSTARGTLDDELG